MPKTKWSCQRVLKFCHFGEFSFPGVPSIKLFIKQLLREWFVALGWYVNEFDPGQTGNQRLVRIRQVQQKCMNFCYKSQIPYSIKFLFVIYGYLDIINRFSILCVNVCLKFVPVLGRFWEIEGSAVCFCLTYSTLNPGTSSLSLHTFM